MRVLIVTGSFPPMRCGIGDYSQSLAEELAKNHNINVAILTSLTGKSRTKNSINVFEAIKKWEIINIFSAIKVIKNWNPDIVHIQYPTQGYGRGWLPYLLPMISFLMGKKIVQTWHEVHSRRDILELVLKSIVPSRLIFVRPQYKRMLHACLHWALWKKQTAFIPNASVIPRIELSDQTRLSVKKLYLKNQKRLVVFFGFVYPNKGVELLFEIANPASDQIVIAGGIDKDSEYAHEILELASAESWRQKVTILGFLPTYDVAALLTVADAVILPFRTGGGEWNTSIHGAVLNGALVITTSLSQNGYDKKRNVYFAKVNDVQEMKHALETYAGNRREYNFDIYGSEWVVIAEQHYLLYKNLLLS